MKNIDGKAKVLGIVAEYNPWHRGHEYQLKQAMKISGAEYSVGIMNGNFTQRGEPALLDKWTRAEMALKGGIDLVVELPFYYGCNSAEYFAKGAVKLMVNSGIVTHMGFGSESGNMDAIREIADVLAHEPLEFKKLLGEKLNEGYSFPKARMKALSEFCKSDCAEMLLSPNNILAVEYVKQLIKHNSSIKPVTVKREGGGYHDTNRCQIASATAIRKALKELKEMHLSPACRENAILEIRNMVPESTFEILMREKDSLIFKDDKKFFDLLRHVILRDTDLAETFSAAEGIENVFQKNVRMCSDRNELIEQVKSKRYTYAGISRTATQMVMNYKKNEKEPSYIRILGFTEKGRELLKLMKKSISDEYTLITNVNKFQGDMSLDIRATDVYNMLSDRDLYKNSDFVKKPVIINK